MNQNPMSEPIFADDVSDRSRHVSAPGNAAGPGLATAAAPRSQAPVSTLSEASGALPDGHPATLPVARGGVADASLLQELRGVRAPTPSVWFMRQAGRSLPEYRSLREGTTMLDSCVRPDMAAEITLQPVRRHGVDAGIFFSDIVVPARLAGLGVRSARRGPVFDHPVRTEADIDARRARRRLRPRSRRSGGGAPDRRELGTLPDRLRRRPLHRRELHGRGRSQPRPPRLALMRSRPDPGRAWRPGRRALGRFLRAQVLGRLGRALFDSWVGALGEGSTRARQAHSAAALAHVADLPVPRLHFGVGAAHLLLPMLEAGATAMGVDHRLRLDRALEVLPAGTPVQGNIDPAVLFTSEEARFAEARSVLAAGAKAPGHVVNLGHGVPPDTDPQVLTDLVAFLHSQGAPTA